MVFEPEPNPTKVVREKSTSKQVVVCFFGKTGHVATVPLEHRRKVNSEWYTTICLPEVFGEIRKTNKKNFGCSCQNYIILYMTMRSLTHRLKAASFDRPKRRIEGSSAVQPAANNFFLFPHIKKQIRGQQFSSPEDAVKAFKTHILEASQSEWKNSHK